MVAFKHDCAFAANPSDQKKIQPQRQNYFEPNRFSAGITVTLSLSLLELA